MYKTSELIKPLPTLPSTEAATELVIREHTKLSLTIKVQWLPVRASWLDQIEIWFSKLQSKVLRPNDFENVPTLVRAIELFMDYCNQTAQPIK